MYEDLTLPTVPEWTAALRSGKYDKGVGRLCKTFGDTQAFCCLGVLLDMAGVPFTTNDEGERIYPANLRISVNHPDDDLPFENNNSGLLPAEIAERYGMNSLGWCPAYIKEKDGETTTFRPITDVNDSPSGTFADVADELDRRYALGCIHDPS